MDGTADRYRHSDEMSLSHQSAMRVVPVILAATGPICSVVDLGGGDGGWLQAFQQHGVEKVLLIDSPTAEPHLVIEKDCFEPCHLDRAFPAPQRFDLALCLECGEHLPAHRAAPLVEWLTTVADRVVFSAAFPGQGGRGHINEQPPGFWEDLFRQHGFQRHDVLRSRIVSDRGVAWWYRQNLFLFSKVAAGFPFDDKDFLPPEFCLVHTKIIDRLQHPGLRTVLRSLIPAWAAAFQRRSRLRSD